MENNKRRYILCDHNYYFNVKNIFKLLITTRTLLSTIIEFII